VDNPAAFVMWLMLGVFVTLCMAFLVATSRADELDTVKVHVDNRMSYVYYKGRRFASPREGNCWAFALSYMAEAMKRGLHRDGALLVDCQLESGEWHSYYRTYDGRALDVRFRYSVDEKEVGCI
jgi:hypothetical protein